MNSRNFDMVFVDIKLELLHVLKKARWHVQLFKHSARRWWAELAEHYSRYRALSLLLKHPDVCCLVFVSVFVVYQLERESAEQHDEGPAAVAGVAEHCVSTLQLSANTVRFTSVCYR